MDSDPIELHGFSICHRAGFTGAKQKVAVIEDRQSNFERNLIFKRSTNNDIDSGPQLMKYYDCSARYPVLSGYEDKSPFRWSEEESDKIFCGSMDVCEYEYKNNKSEAMRHDGQVIGLIVGNKTRHFCGGGAPNAVVSMYQYSLLYPNFLSTPSARIGTAHWSVFESIDSLGLEPDKMRKRKDSCKKNLTLNDESSLINCPCDASILTAILEAAKTSKVINMSMNFTSICSPTDLNFIVPNKILTQIGNALVENDSILVVAATNSRGSMEYNGYLNSLAQHTDIKDRFLVVINGALSKKEAMDSVTTLDEPVEISFPAEQRQYPVKLYSSSNYPNGQTWQDCAVTAIGTHIRFDENSIETGTSFATPLVTSLCALKREQSPQMNGGKLFNLLKRIV